MDRIRELTTVLIPSFFETTLKGLNALKALKPLMKEMFVSPANASKIQVKKENITIIKSRMFQASFK